MTDITEDEKKLFREIREGIESNENSAKRKTRTLKESWSAAGKAYNEGRKKVKIQPGDKEELKHLRTYTKGMRKKKNPIGFSIFG